MRQQVLLGLNGPNRQKNRAKMCQECQQFRNHEAGNFFRWLILAPCWRILVHFVGAF